MATGLGYQLDWSSFPAECSKWQCPSPCSQARILPLWQWKKPVATFRSGLGSLLGLGRADPYWEQSCPVSQLCPVVLLAGLIFYHAHTVWVLHRQRGEQLPTEPSLPRAVHLCGDCGTMQQQGAPCPPQRHAKGRD